MFLQNGTGIVFFGFPSCEFCQGYVPVLNEVAKELDVDKIYYLNIKSMRAENTDEYKKLVELTQNYLGKDKDENYKIFVPDTYFIKDGEILAHNNSMSMIENKDAQEYFNEEKRKELKKELKKNLLLIYPSVCSDVRESIYGC